MPRFYDDQKEMFHNGMNSSSFGFGFPFWDDIRPPKVSIP